MITPATRGACAFVALTLLSSSALVTSRAIADEPIDKEACVAAYEATQKLKQDGKLVDARAQALTCAQEGCPAVVRDECTQWAVEIEKATPTVVFVVTDPDGKDVTDVSVFVDDEKVTDHLDGKPLPIDVGKHKLRFEATGFGPLELDILARAGEHDRTVEAKLPRAGDEGSATSDATSSSDGSTATSAPVPTATYVLLGLGVLSLGSFAAFGVSGNSKRHALDDANCKPACNSDDVDAAKKSFLLADISLGVAVVSLGVASILFFTRGPSEPKPEPSGVASLTVDVAPTKGGGSALVRFRF